MTLKEVLIETHKILDGISVPVSLVREVGFPIVNAMENLQRCLDAIPDPPTEETEERAIREEDL